VGFNGARNDKLLGIFHEIVEEYMGKELALKGFIFPLLVDVKDVKVSFD
jgi:hypothetical protein